MKITEISDMLAAAAEEIDRYARASAHLSTVASIRGRLADVKRLQAIAAKYAIYR